MIGMAKSDSFFIRAKTDYNGTTFTQSSIDLGAYVDALGKSVLRIHNITVQYGSPNDPIAPVAASSVVNSFQLTTQSQTSMEDVTNKSVIASGKLSAISGNTGVTTPVITEALDIAPQMWSSGYLVGVEQIYLGVDSTASANLGIGQCGIVLECTVETLSSSAAMALALSQQ
tara:strand:- start:383 stop:898 length:516 start_codon:yes stop_codon:yes gene_type:complete